MRARGTALLLGAALVLLTSGCGMRAGSTPSATVDPTRSGSASVDADVADLDGGFWRIEDASTQGWVRFGPSSVSVFEAHGRVDGALASEGDQLLVEVVSWSMTLQDDHAVPWLADAVSVARDGAARQLLDADGRRTARLERDGGPPASEQYETDPTDPAAATRPEAVAGSGAATIARDALRGTWRLPGAAAVQLRFDADTWRTRTTCESGTGATGDAGRYRVIEGGLLLMTAEPVGGVGCADDVPSPPAGARAVTDAWTARSIRLDGDRLTLFDAAGRPLGTLER